MKPDNTILVQSLDITGDRPPCAVWSALYERKPTDDGFNCWTVVFGQRDGPPITEVVAFTLARDLLEKDPDLERLCQVAPHTPWGDINKRQREYSKKVRRKALGLPV